MIETVSVDRLKAVDKHQRDFYKDELLKMGFFKMPDGCQLYEVPLDEIERIYFEERARLKHERQEKTPRLGAPVPKRG